MVSQPSQRILFVDNDVDFRTVRAEFLEAHYQVIQAGSIKEAEDILQHQWVHLALFDIRLHNDADRRDLSGLNLAKRASYCAIPKIILTGYPTYETVRDALGPALEGLPAAVGFVAKQEGPDAMLQAIENAFVRHVRINWTLVIQFAERQPLTFPYLTTLIETDLTGEYLQHRAAELEDVFRRLFYDTQQLRIERLLWQHQGRLALSVMIFHQNMAPEAFVVVCGTNADVTAEVQHYQAYAPKTPGPTGTVMHLYAETTHFAANAYTLTQAELGKVHTLREHYRTASEKDLHTTLTGLLQQTLAGWHHHTRIMDETHTPETLYRPRLALTEKRLSRAVFDDRLHDLIRQLPTLGLRIERAAGKLTVALHGRTWSYPDPLPFVYQMPPSAPPLLMLNTPGRLTGDNILTDAEGRTWLTDFATAGPAPLAWNAVALEAELRFDWVETTDLHALLRMEEMLTTQPFQQFDVQDIEPPALRKPVRAIRIIRRLTAELLDADMRSYHLGMFFQAVSRLAAFDPALQLPPHELARLAHILIASGILCQQLVAPEAGGSGETRAGLRLDWENHAVWVDDRRVMLRGQSYDLLCYLYQHAGKLCTRRNIVEQVLQQTFDDLDESQRRRLNTAISRLRERLGDGPRQPRYLHTEPGGYRLVPQGG